jgi:hypothetical protein
VTRLRRWLVSIWRESVRMFRRKQRPGTLRTGSSADVDHLATFIKSRQGVEAYLEPRTAVTEMTIVLVAGDGEWTRRRMTGVDGVRDFAKKYSIPVYDAGIVGYPQRMRDWTARRKSTGQTGVPGLGGPSV